MTCPVCQKPGILSCSGCSQVSYCSVAHQLEKWKVHKKSCSPFIIKVNEEHGTHWVAARNLKAGVILCDELPAFHAPQYNQSIDMTSGTCFCVTCGIQMTKKKKHRCARCGWPVCSRECESLPIHKLNECKLFSSKRIKFSSSGGIPSDELSWCILMVRGMGLKTQNESLYNETINLLHIHQVPNAHADVARICEEHYQNVLKILGSLEYDGEEYQRILRLTLINGFTAGASNVTAVYPKSSRINHSCSPNCTREIGPRPDYKIRIRTSIPVTKGEHLTVTYYNGQTFKGTVQRQLSMRSGRGCGGFICRCSRCLDPTEFGTMMSAITCRECQEINNIEGRGQDFDDKFGYYLPLDPLDVEEEAKWQCNGCGTMEVASTFNPIMNKLELMVNFGLQSYPSDRIEYVSLCDSIIQDYGGNILHPNHWLIQLCSESIIDVMNEMELMDKNSLEKYIQLSMYMLAIRDVITPGISTDKDLLQRHTSKALTTLIRLYAEYIDKPKVMEHLETCQRLQDELWKFQKNDIATDPAENKKLLSEMSYIKLMANAYANAK